LEDFEGALEDLNASIILKPNNTTTLQHRRVVKKVLNDYQEFARLKKLF
jgi:hypothetical protein